MIDELFLLSRFNIIFIKIKEVKELFVLWLIYADGMIKHQA